MTAGKWRLPFCGEIGRRWQRAVFLLISGLLLFVYAKYQLGLWITCCADNAFIAQLSRNIAARGVPMSQVAQAVTEAFDSILTVPAAQLCSEPLTLANSGEFNYFRWHTYWVLYLLAPIHWLIDPEFTLPFLMASGFVFVPIAAYKILRRENVPVGASALSAWLLMLHPAWTVALQGQVYVDRLFVPLGFAFLMALHYRPNNLLLITGIGTLLALLTDRTGLIAGAILGGHSVLSYRRGRAVPWSKLILAMALGLFSFAVIKLYIQHPHYDGFSKTMLPASFAKNLVSNDAFRSKLFSFLAINILIFGPFAALAPKYFLLSIALMAPNILGNIGGAEKTGFATHYHSLYYPVLAFAMVLGCLRLWRISARRRYMFAIATVTGAFLALGLNHETWDDVRLSYRRVSSAPFFLPWRQALQRDPDRTQAMRGLRAEIPPGSRVTTPESFMPALSSHSAVHYFPLALEDADIAVLPITRGPDGKVQYNGVTTYLGTDEETRIRACLFDRMRLIGYDFENARISHNFAIVKNRKSKRSNAEN